MHKNKLYISVFLLLLIITFVPGEGIAMSLLYHPEEELVLCSPMEGKITHNGVPVVGAKVERLIKWKDDTGQTDTTTTDKDGHFTLPEIRDKAKVPKLSQFVLLQEVRVFHEGEAKLFWALSQMGKEHRILNGELGGEPIVLRCELNTDVKYLRLEDAYLVTICESDSIKQTDGE